MSIYVRLTDAERESGRWHPQHMQQAFETFIHQGCLVLQNVFAPAFIDQLAQAYALARPQVPGESLWNYGLPVGPGREITTLPLKAPFNAADFYAPPLICALLAKFLDSDFVLSSCSVVMAQPGAETQRVHRDIDLLYGDSRVSLLMPSFAITVGIPLIDLTEATGTTAMFPGTHQQIVSEQMLAAEPLRPLLARGDAYLFDCRLFHFGTPNLTDEGRPIVYLNYCRSWFLDEGNPIETLFADQAAVQNVPSAWPRLLRRAALLP